MKSFEILQEMLLTEKTNIELSGGNRYSFVVDPRARKSCIAKAVETAFGVKVAKVNVTNCHGKLKRVRSKNSRKYTIVGAKKKASVFLKPGNKIDVA